MAKPRERGILFSAPMVRALLDGRKTQTRRVILPQPRVPPEMEHDVGAAWDAGFVAVKCPYGSPGDRLWVRERARLVEVDDGLPFALGISPEEKVRVRYEADGTESGWVAYPQRLAGCEVGKCLAYGCYREASRITLELNAVRVQRLQEISEEDALAEGSTPLEWQRLVTVGDHDRVEPGGMTARNTFAVLWNSINGGRPEASWAANPWVWALTFRRVEVASNA